MCKGTLQGSGVIYEWTDILQENKKLKIFLENLIYIQESIVLKKCTVQKLSVRSFKKGFAEMAKYISFIFMCIFLIQNVCPIHFSYRINGGRHFW